MIREPRDKRRRVTRTYKRGPARLLDIHATLLTGCLVDANGCWIWQGALRGGPTEEYGAIKIKGRVMYVHRLSLDAKLKEQGGRLGTRYACHQCTGPKSCCNPDHLEPGTQAKNMRDYYKSPKECVV